MTADEFSTETDLKSTTVTHLLPPVPVTLNRLRLIINRMGLVYVLCSMIGWLGCLSFCLNVSVVRKAIIGLLACGFEQLLAVPIPDFWGTKQNFVSGDPESVFIKNSKWPPAPSCVPQSSQQTTVSETVNTIQYNTIQHNRTQYNTLQIQ